MEEVPALRQMWDLLMSGFTSNGSWSVVLVGGRRKQILEKFDSRYSAEQGLKRWEGMRRDLSADDFARAVADATGGLFR